MPLDAVAPAVAPARLIRAEHRPLDPRTRVLLEAPIARTLLRLANVERNSHLSANWGRLEKSLAPYRAVLKGTEP